MSVTKSEIRELLKGQRVEILLNEGSILYDSAGSRRDVCYGPKKISGNSKDSWLGYVDDFYMFEGVMVADYSYLAIYSGWDSLLNQGMGKRTSFLIDAIHSIMPLYSER